MPPATSFPGSRRMLTLCILLTLGLQAATCYLYKGRKPPNILFVMSDDLGWNDVSWHNPDVITPNLQSLASNGVIMNQSYVQSVCSPSRAAYLTGLYPYHVGFQNGVVSVGAVEYLPLHLTLLPERLKKLGYSTNLVGKWHLGYCNEDATPTLRGFDYFFGCYSAGIDYYTKRLPPNPLPGVNVSVISAAYDLSENLDIFWSPPSEYVTDLFTQKAVDVINNHDTSKPLFLSQHYTAPHFPLQVPDEYLDLYPNEPDLARQTYLAMVTKIDEGVGKIVAALKDKGMFEDTIIIFTSDNGAVNGLGGGSNFPLRDVKGSHYEGGVRSPTFIHGPNHIVGRGRVSNDLFHIVDWFPTLLCAAGDSSPARDLDGMNQWLMLSRGIKGRRNHFVYNIADDHFDNSPIYAIRVGNYKLIEGNARGFLSSGISPARQPNWICDCELYNLHYDPTESKDLAAQQPEVVIKMYAILNELKKSQVPPLLRGLTPLLVPEGNPSNFNNTVTYGWC